MRRDRQACRCADPGKDEHQRLAARLRRNITATILGQTFLQLGAALISQGFEMNSEGDHNGLAKPAFDV
jgi:hypothetical protein